MKLESSKMQKINTEMPEPKCPRAAMLDLMNNMQGKNQRFINIQDFKNQFFNKESMISSSNSIKMTNNDQN